VKSCSIITQILSNLKNLTSVSISTSADIHMPVLYRSICIHLLNIYKPHSWTVNTMVRHWMSCLSPACQSNWETLQAITPMSIR